MLINWHGQETRTGGAQNLNRSQVGRILDGDRVPALDQHTRDQIERLLGPVNDDHTVWITVYGARPPEVSADRLSQQPVAGSESIVELGYRRVAGASQQHAIPERKWKGCYLAAVGEIYR